MRVEEPQISKLMFEEKVGPLGGASKDAIKVRVFHKIKNTFEILRLRLIQTNPTSHQHKQFIAIGFNIIQKNAIIIAY